MNYLDSAQWILRTAARLGTAKIVYSIVDNNVDATHTFDKVTVGVGSFYVAGLVNDAVAAKVNGQFETLRTSLAKFKSTTSETPAPTAE